MTRPLAPILLFVLASVALAAAPPQAGAQGQRSFESEGHEVSVVADHFEQIGADNLLVATGDVEVIQGTKRLLADRVEINRETGDVVAEGRVIFYDYDELCLITECNFRDIPRPRNDEEEMSGEPWFFVGERDVFPEEFLPFLGLSEPLERAFVTAHSELLTPEFWRRMQELHQAGEIVHIFPYRQEKRLRPVIRLPREQ